ncbi:type I-E CRISPR-associated protein Cas7/Cse4/CasC [Streptomyces sp. NPDC020412]|uniref:type I-E CRISPR-associated protein Cas7/Cse4/CasC n=1 Tax=Streptomyces sp. NPDC020412 TaxID=3365073 RepID=UPI0037A3FCA1
MPHPRLFVDVHVLQTVPPANLNRDDQGNPKEAYFGGVRRSRVSSQAWKRATRMHFTERMAADDLATRTRRFSGDLAARLRRRTGLPEKSADRLANALVTALGITPGKKQGDTAYLFFYGHRQLDAVAELVAERAAELDALPDKELKKQIEELDAQQHFRSGQPLDIALFGRMVADIPALRVDAATQVAHALSTHAVELEFDYFTAVDDRVEKDQESGAGMIGTIGFNSATLYRYATVGLHQLRHNLRGDATDAAGADHDEAAVQGVAEFVTSFARSVPAGYKNSFAHRTLPSLVAVVVRGDQPVNLVSAFEEPVAGSSGIATRSAQRLAREHAVSVSTWGDVPSWAGACHSFDAESAAGAELTGAFGAPVSFPGLLSGLREHLSGRVAEAGAVR